MQARLSFLLLVFSALVLLTSPAFSGGGGAPGVEGVSPRCEAAIDKATGSYSQCLLKASSRFAKNADQDVFNERRAKCGRDCNSRVDRALAKFGQDSCTLLTSEIRDRTMFFAESATTEAGGTEAPAARPSVLAAAQESGCKAANGIWDAEAESCTPAPSYSCFTGGLCSQLAASFPPSETGHANAYAGHTKDTGAALAAGCNVEYGNWYYGWSAALLIHECLIGEGGGNCYGYGPGHVSLGIAFDTFGPACANGAPDVAVTEPPPTPAENCFDNDECTCCYETSGAYTCSAGSASAPNCLQSDCTCCYETSGEYSCS